MDLGLGCSSCGKISFAAHYLPVFYVFFDMAAGEEKSN
jgi:hypothetical protein